MAVKFKSIAGRVSAVALALATIAVPSAAYAQQEERAVRDNEPAGNIGGAEARRAPRAMPAEGGWSRPARAEGGWSRPAPAAAPAAEAPNAATARSWAGRTQGGDAAPAPNWRNGSEGTQGDNWRSRSGAGSGDGWRSRGDAGSGGGWRGRGGWNGGGDEVRTAPPAPPAPPASPASPSRGWGDGNRDGNRDGRSWWNGSRNGDRDGRNWRNDNDRRWQGNDRRDWHRDDDRWRGNDSRWRGNDSRWRYGDNGWRNDRNDYRHDYRRWDNRWRDNRRYDWFSYRRSYPSVFRLGGYYAPYRNYSYRRLSIGFYLDSLFFSSRYLINDPWQYRLPEVYGPYRWVRYYDDALLVNVYSGEVVDVIYSFFW